MERESRGEKNESEKFRRCCQGHGAHPFLFYFIFIFIFIFYNNF